MDRHLCAVVQCTAGWREGQVSIRSDSGSVPAMLQCPLHHQHVVCEGLPKHQGIRIRLRLVVVSQGNIDSFVLHHAREGDYSGHTHRHNTTCRAFAPYVSTWHTSNTSEKAFTLASKNGQTLAVWPRP